MTRLKPRWQAAQRVSRSRFSEQLWHWLLDPGSLTRRLQIECDGQFRVRLLHQGLARPSLDEARLLGLRSGAWAHAREVYLLCRGLPFVFARTVIPTRTLQGKYRRLARLGNRPLGAVLFADKSMRRDALQLACIRPGHALFARATRQLPNTSTAAPATVWGRRSLFHLGQKTLLLSELFLHDMAQCKPLK